MPFNIGLVLAPLVPLLMVAKQPGPVATLYKAGAVSPETARKPSSVKAKGDLTGSLKSGIVIPTGDGRYYVDERAYLRMRKRNLVAICLTVVLSVVASLIIWEPWQYLI